MNNPFPFPSKVNDWLSWIFCRFQSNGNLLPGEPSLNFLSPLTATDNPNNPTGASCDIGFVGGIVAYTGPPISSATYAILPNISFGFNTSINAIAMTTPGSLSLPDGTRFQAYDAGRYVETNQCTLTDPNAYLIQNPIDLELYSTITWGAGSGGGSNPNLPRGFPATWQRTTVTVSSVTKTYWQWVG